MARSVRRARYELVARRRSLGESGVRVAVQLRACWPDLTARAALRLAQLHESEPRCWTQGDVMLAWGQMFPDVRAPEPKEVSRWEIWPRAGGKQPSFRTLDHLAQLYRCSISDLVADVGNYRPEHSGGVAQEEDGVVATPRPRPDERFVSVQKGDRSTKDGANELRERLAAASAVDDATLLLLGDQVDAVRRLDRTLGARPAAAQLRGHLEALQLLHTFSVSPSRRERLAALHADAATLAGWQSLDLGQFDQAWRYYESAKGLAIEADAPGAMSHALAEQAYVLLDLDDTGRALQLVDYALKGAGTKVPPLLRAWLTAVRGEVQAAAGDPTGCQTAFDEAARLLPADEHDPNLPYLVLNPIHLARWRGHALAKLGDPTATVPLIEARDGLDSSFVRARAGLHVDLARAFALAGQTAAAIAELKPAASLARQVGSTRHQRRIARLASTLGVTQGEELQ